MSYELLRKLGRVVGASALTALLSIMSLTAQVSVQSALFEERNVMAGENYQIEIVVYNSSPVNAEILVVQKDYLFKDNVHHFLDSGRWERSNAGWIKVPHVRMLLLARRKTKLLFSVEVPEDVNIGTHHSILGIETKAVTVKKTQNVSMGMNVRYNIQVVTNVNSEEARKALKIVATEVKDSMLLLTIRNVGEQVLRFGIVPPIPGIQTDRKGRVYPDMEQTFELDISELSDGEYKELRFLLDDGRDFIQPVYVSFVKGIIPSKAELHTLEGERIERGRRRTRSFFLPRIYAVLTYGSNYKSANLSGSMRLFGNLISVRGGSSYREVQSNLIYGNQLTYRLGAALSLKNLRVGYNAYFFEDSVSEMANASYRFKNFNVNCNYVLSRKILQGSLSQRLWRGWSVRLSTFFDFERQRKSYVASLSIPIL